MTHKLKIEIRCGEKTCASEPRKFCNFFGTRHFGQKSCCLLYTDHGSPLELFENEDGWISRCQPCLDQLDPGKWWEAHAEPAQQIRDETLVLDGGSQ